MNSLLILLPLQMLQSDSVPSDPVPIPNPIPRPQPMPDPPQEDEPIKLSHRRLRSARIRAC
ncbi:hypothetical protein C3432_23215 [Citrobacter amalonaticus]|uniref:Uncharacterized protein n=1 Tax=Citrobacter amalonaticus TaxID=35703 RepID=A0A2S4S1D9_CITAM|nr:hypothetical protein C3432_23215 [Citrobacter amalonaticus]POT77191.1 hypothetical protein C3436_07080 [Citrobacter amalonaticus]POU67642.1 hypothetical protein C3430_00615 [Citrobacter amalonaticus]POV07247.1 hypothetical protein C3424_00625 [Citrobacter amalonaticus]